MSLTTRPFSSLSALLDKQPIDVVIHNAGVMTDETLQDLDLDRIRHNLKSIALAPLRTNAGAAVEFAQRQQSRF